MSRREGAGRSAPRPVRRRGLAVADRSAVHGAGRARRPAVHLGAAALLAGSVLLGCDGAELVVGGSDGPTGFSGSWASVSAGADHSCALDTEGRAFCWGANTTGQLGNGTFSDFPSEEPVPVEGGLSFLRISAGAGFTCAVSTANVAYCWGQNEAGQLGSFTGETCGPDFCSTSPAAVSEPAQGPVAWEAAGASGPRDGDHACGVTGDGDLYCWGTNLEGELGAGPDVQESTEPLLISSGRDTAGNAVSLRGAVGAVDAGSEHSCAALTGDRFACWGRNLDGELAAGIRTEVERIPLVSPFGATAVDAGSAVTCLLEGTLAACAGSNEFFQLGDADFDPLPSAEPRAVDGGIAWSVVSVGDEHVCGVADDETPYCWGTGDEGQLGNGERGEFTRARSPTTVSTDAGFATVSAGLDHTCGVTVDGDAFCWGANDDGQLGDGTRDVSAVPVPVAEPGGG